MISSAQIRAARALLGIDQKQLAEMAGVSVPTIQRMEASKTEHVRGVVDTLTTAGANRAVRSAKAARVKATGCPGLPSSRGRAA